MTALLAATSWIPGPTMQMVVLATVIVLGVPHGALDGEIARTLMRPGCGRRWFPAFAVPYLGLAAGVLVAWRVAPMPTLAAFLAASVWHFGREDAGPANPLAVLALGGLPVALPVLLHPQATARLFGTVAMIPMEHLPDWLVIAAVAWCGVTLCWIGRSLANGRPRDLREPGLLLILFAALPPLIGFAAYFVCVHAPRHMRALLEDPRVPRVRTMRDAVWRSLPITLLTILIGAALWRRFPGTAPDRLLSLTIEGLAALTLPHMLLDHLSTVALRHPRLIYRPVLLS